MSSISKRLPNLAAPNECTGCLSCVAICPKGALRQIVDSEGHIAVELDSEKCISCLQCEGICEESRKGYGTNSLAESSVYCGWAKENGFRERGTSGGIFASVAAVILREGGAVFGAAFDGRRCAHIAIDQVEDIPKLQQSKYVQSSLANVYKEIEKCLPYRKVLFTGTGCQVNAVLAYLRDSQFLGNLYTMDIVCGGVPSSALIDKYLNENPDCDGIAAFRNKDRYALSVYKKGRPVVLAEKALPLWGYCCGMTNRYSCYHCQFTYPHRRCDITVGDCWNYELFPEEHAKGISTVLIHTIKGKELISKSRTELHPVRWEDVLYTNKRIAYGNEKIFLPRKLLARNIEEMSYEQFDRLYCMKMKPWNVPEYLFKIFHRVMFDYEKMKAKRYIEQLIREESFGV